jgi:hypothetical protein
MRLKTDLALRKALHGLYVALFKARKTSPDDFHDGRLTTILTAIMGIENYSWRVVGITMEALDLLAAVDFNKNKLPRSLCRGHKYDRIKTTKKLFNQEKPMQIDEFFKVFLRNDQTVIMLNKQNQSKDFPEYIKFDNPDAELFPNGSLMGWKHRKKERDYLRQLHALRSAR